MYIKVPRSLLRICLSCLHFQFRVLFSLFICFNCKMSQNYIDLRFFLDIKVLTQQTKGAGVVAAYCSWVKLWVPTIYTVDWDRWIFQPLSSTFGWFIIYTKLYENTSEWLGVFFKSESILPDIFWLVDRGFKGVDLVLIRLAFYEIKENTHLLKGSLYKILNNLVLGFLTHLEWDVAQW